ncbi:hypothetical protein D3C78_1878500 [compost metagenome]
MNVADATAFAGHPVEGQVQRTSVVPDALGALVDDVAVGSVHQVERAAIGDKR